MTGQTENRYSRADRPNSQTENNVRENNFSLAQKYKYHKFAMRNVRGMLLSCMVEWLGRQFTVVGRRFDLVSEQEIVFLNHIIASLKDRVPSHQS